MCHFNGNNEIFKKRSNSLNKSYCLLLQDIIATSRLLDISTSRDKEFF